MPKGTYIRTEEIKQKLRLANLGKKHSEETKRKLSEIGKKRQQTEDTKKKIGDANRREKNGMWKGDKVGYYGLHIWVTGHLGRPLKCEHCKKSGLKGRQIHWANKSGEYKRDLADWIRLCVPCHKKYDAK